MTRRVTDMALLDVTKLTGDLMLLLGWTSEDMPRHYGASAAAERAQEIQVQLGIREGV